MSDRVRMTSLSVFQNERITVFREGGPADGEKGLVVTVGDAFETDLTHAKELDRLKLAEPVDRADLEGEPSPLEPHYQVSVPELRADLAAREASAVNATTDMPAPTTVGSTEAGLTEQPTTIDAGAEGSEPPANATVTEQPAEARARGRRGNAS